MNDRPLSVFSDPYRDRFHETAAIGCAVSWLYVHMEARKAVRAVVAVVASGSCRDHQASALLTGKAIRTCMCFIIPFFKVFLFVFTVH